MIVGISLILITIGLVLFLSFGPGNSTQQYYMAAAPAKKNDCPGGKKRDPKTGACPVDKKVDPKVPKKDPKVPPKKVDPNNCKNGMKFDPKTGKCGYQLQARGWDTVVDTASLAGNQPPQKPLEFVTTESFPDASGKCGKGTTLQKNGRCGPNNPTLSGPQVNGQIVPPNNPIVTGVGFGDTVFQGNQPQGGKPPPVSPAVVVVPPGDKPKPPGDKPPPPPPPVVVVPAGGGGDKPKPRPPVKCKAGYIEKSPGVCVPDPTVEDLGEIPGEGGGGAA